MLWLGIYLVHRGNSSNLLVWNLLVRRLEPSGSEGLESSGLEGLESSGLECLLESSGLEGLLESSGLESTLGNRSLGQQFTLKAF